MELSKSQKMFQKISSEEKFRKMMEESKQWKFTCQCGEESSIWDVGGIRYKASGNPKIRLKCPHCQKTAMQKLYKAEA